jgi:chromosome segregation ATPase
LISASRNEILTRQREASQAIERLNMEYNCLSKEWNKRDTLVKEDNIDKEKLEDITEQRKNRKNNRRFYNTTKAIC